ncbi:MAG: intein-containing RctB family protein [Thermoplasmata archaeon]
MGRDWKGPLEKLDDYRYRIPKSYKEEMRAPGVIYADAELLQNVVKDFAPEQVANVATMPGIQKASMAMPDIHWGYGFPIGGVAAFDEEEEGVLSPGGVGFDISCLSGGSKVLTSLGYTLPIQDFEDRWRTTRLTCVNPRHRTVSTRVAAFMKFEENRAYKVTTSLGVEITATPDHPFLTPDGMRPLREVADRPVAVYPFKGVDYAEPPDTPLVTKDLLRTLAPAQSLAQIVPFLKKRDLLPLTPRHPRFPYLLKIFGFVLGDGYASAEGARPVVWFYGSPRDLEDIRDDVRRLGFRPSRIYTRLRHHRVSNPSGEYAFDTTEASFKVSARSLHLLLRALGLPIGNKAKQDFRLPEWLFRLPLWQKRLFLAALFGAEMSAPKTMTGHDFNFYCPVFSLSKREGFQGSGLGVAEDVARLIRDFGISVHRIGRVVDRTPERGDASYRFRVLVASDGQNLIRFFTTVNFEYHAEKRFLANAAAHYLTVKEMVRRRKVEAGEVARRMHGDGRSRDEILEKLSGRFVTRSFLVRRLDGKEGRPRTWSPFPTFNQFVERLRASAGTAGIVWDRIVSLEEVPTDEVYDFTVTDEHHNFIADGFVVSNCGVRLIRTNLGRRDVGEKLRPLVDTLFENIPSGVGKRGKARLSQAELKEVLAVGAPWMVERGHGWDQDLEMLEEGGSFDLADPERISQKALARGMPQLGSLGAGNHFVELQYVEGVREPAAAKAMGIDREGQVCIMIHTGSRGFGHQVATDYIRLHEQAVRKYGIELPDRQLASAPIQSQEAQDYFHAMYAGANFAFANRQLITDWVRKSFENALGTPAEDLEMEIVYDVSHNMAKLEEHRVDGSRKQVYVHRKGATRAFPPGNPEIPLRYRDIGQPVLIPGSMGTHSFVLVGTEGAMEQTFGSTCHGAGRVMSRKAASRKWQAREVQDDLARQGIYAHSASWKGLVEEAPGAYKDVDNVVEVCQGAGISDIVVKLKPMGVVKG